MSIVPPPGSGHGAIQDVLGAYALDAVDDDERLRIETHLETCASCRDELAVLRETAGSLAGADAPAPAHVWDAIAAQLAGAGSEETAPEWTTIAERLAAPEPPVVPLSPVAPLSPEDPRSSGDPDPRTPGRGRGTRRTDTASRRWPLRAVLAVAAALALVVVGVGVHANRLQHQVSALESGTGMTGAEQAALQAPGTRRVVLTSTTAPAGTGPRVTVVLPVSGSGFVEAGSLAALPAGHTYQLWGIADGSAVSLGLLGSDPGVVAIALGGHAPPELAITDEAAGGSVQPTSAPLVSGTVT